METLTRFWQRVRPFGWWRCVMARVHEPLVRQARRESRVDVVNAFFATAWHVTGVVCVISLLLHRWNLSLGAVGVFAVLTVVLYVTWYRTLQSPEDAAAQERQT